MPFLAFVPEDLPPLGYGGRFHFEWSACGSGAGLCCQLAGEGGKIVNLYIAHSPHICSMTATMAPRNEFLG